jgi:hypothetical protein
LLKHRRTEARRLRASARLAAGLEAAHTRAATAALDARLLIPHVADAIEERLLLFAWEELPYQSVAEALEVPAPARTARAEGDRKGEVAMKPVELARTLRRDAILEPKALDRGKAVLMAAIQKELESRRRPRAVPQLPYEDIHAALSFLERAFGFREVATSRMVNADGRILQWLHEAPQR